MTVKRYSKHASSHAYKIMIMKDSIVGDLMPSHILFHFIEL
jgi:hypothetical protein